MWRIIRPLIGYADIVLHNQTECKLYLLILTESTLILNSHRKIEKCSELELRQTRRRTQAGLTPGKDDNEVWHHFCRSRLKVSMGVQYQSLVSSAVTAEIS